MGAHFSFGHDSDDKYLRKEESRADWIEGMFIGTWIGLLIWPTLLWVFLGG